MSMKQNKWLEKFENLLCALNTEKDKKGKAMLLQYAGDRDKVYDIYYSIMDKKKRIGITTTHKCHRCNGGI